MKPNSALIFVATVLGIAYLVTKMNRNAERVVVQKAVQGFSILDQAARQ